MPTTERFPRALDDAAGLLVSSPAPRGGGRTLHNWRVLAGVARGDLDTARLAEAHLDALTILSELDADRPAAGRRWAVWAAEAPGTGVQAVLDAAHGWTLTGGKAWCSGADVATDALVTAAAPDGPRLFAVDLARPGIRVSRDGWAGVGMRRSAAIEVTLDAVPACAVGPPGGYLDRPGFWHGAIAVAAAWLGGADGVADPLRRRVAGGRGDEHDAAHLGTVDAALAAGGAVLREAAAEIDGRADGGPDDPDEEPAAARRRALRARAVVEHAVETAVRATGRAAGPSPLAHDAAHAHRVADLTLYVRQSHAERDLATLGHLAGDGAVL